MKNTKGYLALVLHAHLPFVRHPEYDRFLEEDWLYEAMTETYIPLIQAFEELSDEGVPFRLTMSCTPPLMEMLTDDLLQNRYLRHLDMLIELAEKEVVRTSLSAEFNDTAKMYLDKFRRSRETFLSYNKNLVSAFAKFHIQGNLELITCSATHGFFPLMVDREAKNAQLRQAVRCYREHVGMNPRGIWNAECGYYTGDDELLAKNGIRFFFTDAHGVLYADPRPKYGVFAPIFCESEVAAFGRDIESSKSVWSSEEGYPGDYNYREFYRDIGYDLDFDYLKPYLHGGGLRTNLGIKYHRITGETKQKEPYNWRVAEAKAEEHAGNFIFNRERQVEHLAAVMDRKPIIVSPYDAELYGHWWYEGPVFLKHVLRKAAMHSEVLDLTTPYEYLKEYTVNQMATPTISTWGDKGYSEVWLNASNDWKYRHLHKCQERMVEMANKYGNAEGLTKRALDQMAREVYLAQSSDWAFIMTTDTMVPYAVKRTKDHICRFNELYYMINENRIDSSWLHDIENRDNIFRNTADYRDFQSRNL
ncbi:MAG: glycoside hydrolase family 57 protein [Candidatus Muiribacteriaceae bacterium]